MIRDVKRRKIVTEYAPTRLRINSLRKNDILPVELRDIASKEIEELPRDSALLRTQTDVSSHPGLEVLYIAGD
nr:unnamed protein product [Callosobruchus chinensis]